MKKLFLSALLILISIQGGLFAQLSTQPIHSKAYRLFNILPAVISNRHTAHLQKNEKMIVELIDLADYDMLGRLDTILHSFMKDIAFYKDSLSATESVRIDYRVTEGTDQRMISFTKHAPQGSLFVTQKNTTNVLKLDQDTVHIILIKKAEETGKTVRLYDQMAEVTFCLNNYTDIDTILSARISVKDIIDTMSVAVPNRRINAHRDNLMDRHTQSVIAYYPYRETDKMVVMNTMPYQAEWTPQPEFKRNNIVVNAHIGAGLLMNTICPMADAGIQYNKRWQWASRDYNIFRLSAAPYYFFSKDGQGNIIANDNWFVNFQMGSVYETSDPLWVGNAHTIGIGYLVSEKGGFFKGTTMKLFTDLQIVKGVTIVPEVIATNNFKQFFPGVTLKIF